jgi:membrane fusion protein (multidrug efflux system)
MNKTVKTCLFLFFCAFLGFSTVFVAMPQASGAEKAEKVESAASDSNAIAVNVVQVRTGNIPQTITALGSLTAQKHVVISSETAGRIAAINFKDGQQVARGMPIVQLDNQQAKAMYQTAVTQFHLARQKYERSKQLVDIAISKQNLAVLNAMVATSQAAVQKALADLNEKQVVAPFSGVLGAFQVQAGDYVSAGSPLVTLVNTEQLRADYNLPEKDLPSLKVGQLTSVMTSAYPKKVFYGTVTFISPMVSQSSRMVAIQALINNSKNLLSPGMFVHLSQQIGTIKNTIIIPAAAIVADIKGYFVYKVVGNKVVQNYITVGMRIDAKAQVLKGLTVGDTIVVAGQQKLQDGSTIKIIPSGSS